MTRALGLLLCLVPQFLVVAVLVAREELGLRRGTGRDEKHRRSDDGKHEWLDLGHESSLLK